MKPNNYHPKTGLMAAVAAVYAFGASANAAIVFNDPSFEGLSQSTYTNYSNGIYTATTDQNLDPSAGSPIGNLNAPLPAGYISLSPNRIMTIASSSGFTGATGSNVLVTENSNNPSGFIQYVNDAGSTTGEVTFSIDYARSGVGTSGSSRPNSLIFAPFAFNVGTILPKLSGLFAGNTDVFNGTGYVNNSLFSVNPDIINQTDGILLNVAQSTTMQTLDVTLDLGAGYDYVGVIVMTDSYGFALDNLTVTAVPEPSAALLGGLGLLALLRRRR